MSDRERWRPPGRPWKADSQLLDLIHRLSGRKVYSHEYRNVHGTVSAKGAVLVWAEEGRKVVEYLMDLARRQAE